jgi:cytochrome c biogenesis protein CcmG/thiol:disulfide interchange protein DsbE
MQNAGPNAGLPVVHTPTTHMKQTLLALALVALPLLSLAQSRIPSATVQTMDGKRVDANTFSNDGKPMIINFWATWCAPCKRELSAIAHKYDDWQAKTGVKLIAISIDDARSMARVAPYVNGQDWDYEVYLDPNGDLKRALNVNNVPHTFLVNGDGEIVWQHNNYEPGDENELFRKVLEVAGKK